jgi:hypothetical protein
MRTAMAQSIRNGARRNIRTIIFGVVANAGEMRRAAQRDFMSKRRVGSEGDIEKDSGWK